VKIVQDPGFAPQPGKLKIILRFVGASVAQWKRERKMSKNNKVQGFDIQSRQTEKEILTFVEAAVAQ
jgi:hypothetical protein